MRRDNDGVFRRNDRANRLQRFGFWPLINVVSFEDTCETLRSYRGRNLSFVGATSGGD
jgi:hypothetical protein